jgi:hypothetical protein
MVCFKKDEQASQEQNMTLAIFRHNHHATAIETLTANGKIQILERPEKSPMPPPEPGAFRSLARKSVTPIPHGAPERPLACPELIHRSRQAVAKDWISRQRSLSIRSAASTAILIVQTPSSVFDRD